jgi:hypothetical protein
MLRSLSVQGLTVKRQAINVDPPLGCAHWRQPPTNVSIRGGALQVIDDDFMNYSKKNIIMKCTDSEE